MTRRGARYILHNAGATQTDEAVAPLESAMGSERSCTAPAFLEEDSVAMKTSSRRDGALLVLMTPPERKLIDEAAQADGVATGTWLRMLGLREAKRRLAASK